jgi:hypothetical protein
MGKYKMSAGAEFETLNKKELDASLKEWMVDAVKGCRPVQISAQGSVTAPGTVTLGGATTLTGGVLGPEVGYWWSVTRLAVRVEGQPAAFSVYLNNADGGHLVRDVNGAANGYATFGQYELLFSGSDALIIQASTVGESGLVTVSGAAIELPTTLLWKWLAG